MSPTARRAATGLAGAAAMIAVITVVSRLLGFGRWIAQLHWVGFGSIGDSYNAANTLPNVLFEVAAGGALAGALVPVLAAPVARGARKDIDKTVSGTLGWTLLVLVPLALLLALLSNPIADLLTSANPEQTEMVQFFLRVFAIQVPMYGVAVLLYAVLQAHKRFFWPAFAPIISTVVVTATYVVYSTMSNGTTSSPDALDPGALEWLAWGTTLGVAAMCFPMFLPVRALGVRLRPTLRFPAGVAPRVRSLALAGVGAVAAQQIALLVVLWVAKNWGAEGTFSTFLYSQQVYLLPYAVLVVPLATSTFPRLAARASSADRGGFARLASGTVRAVLAAGAIGAAAVIASAPAVARFFSAVAHDDPALIPTMTAALTWMAPGLVGFAALFHASRSLYALERGRAAVVANSVGWGVMAAAVVAFVGLGIPSDTDAGTLAGIGAASSLGMFVGGAVALVALGRAAGWAALRGVPRSTTVLVISAALGALAGRWVADAVQVIGGEGGLTALGAAAGGALVAALVVGAGLLALDRAVVRYVLQVEREPLPAVGPRVPRGPDGPDVF
ncbi:murein biosynthesis integral membrane protein MurJ [Cellulomonas sp. URHE0023]|uniref:murein biosynthesis integral membrane protein MurJ n=1 Tax=Cellulomonas sp. URHE0023 TaxID=1380354 RepID=UPI0004889AD5|nr:lipid II flippase MurJ [Cellulomonas sp. URHE0023]